MDEKTRQEIEKYFNETLEDYFVKFCECTEAQDAVNIWLEIHALKKVQANFTANLSNQLIQR